jgi:HNH endonuclease
MNDRIPTESGHYLDEFDAERFWEHVNFNGGEPYTSDPIATATGQCWIWLGAKTEAGYAKFRIFGQWKVAHRISFKDFGNRIDDSEEIDHLCRVRNCVNPMHLESVTHLVNISRGHTANRTHCKNGHQYSPENTLLRIKGETTTRICLSCRKQYGADAYRLRKERATLTLGV